VASNIEYRRHHHAHSFTCQLMSNSICMNLNGGIRFSYELELERYSNECAQSVIPHAESQKPKKRSFSFLLRAQHHNNFASGFHSACYKFTVSPTQCPTSHLERDNSEPAWHQFHISFGERVRGKENTDLHLQSFSTVSKVFSNKHSALLTNQESSRICDMMLAMPP
jgi:hypothetical protein